ncbi:zinc finger MYM-type protein 2-like [Acanthaster planci]|uniref:Zinc finger MYM-type protein 2-like n=1 Tax=Acanthaster planci TaxID=133434 RepID=A0A8B7YX63_ACAPL|nr:zinc finger MYM-type protein 2-like [Acanthaster planci]
MVDIGRRRFICEVKKKNGKDYPGETLLELVICVQLYFELKGKSYKFLSDPDFLQLRNTLDGLMKELAKAGFGICHKRAKEITVKEDDSLWQKSVFGSYNPTQLLNTLVYLIGLNFTLRGGQEHRNLRWKSAQLQIQCDNNGDKFLRYTEDAYKTSQGGLQHRHLQPKVVDAHKKEDRERCVVTLFRSTSVTVLLKTNDQTLFTCNRWLSQEERFGMLLSYLAVTNWPRLLPTCANKEDWPVTVCISPFGPVLPHVCIRRILTNNSVR